MDQTVSQSENLHLQAAREGAVYRILQDSGPVQVGGKTRFDYLQRQTSNDLHLLSPQNALRNVLTSPLGRILEVFTVLEEEDVFLLLTPPGRAAVLTAYFRERLFFNDQVDVTDASQHWYQIELHGPATYAVLRETLNLHRNPDMDEVVICTFDGLPVKAMGMTGLTDESGIRLLMPLISTDAFISNCQTIGAVALNEDEAEILRVEAGLPGWGNEVKEDYTPFEVGLADRVSANKGCYTGQEILARQVTYDKITRQLVRVDFDQPIEKGTRLIDDGKAIGEVTSSVISPRLGYIGLAVVRRPYHQTGKQLSLEGGGLAIVDRQA